MNIMAIFIINITTLSVVSNYRLGWIIFTDFVVAIAVAKATPGDDRKWVTRRETGQVDVTAHKEGRGLGTRDDRGSHCE